MMVFCLATIAWTTWATCTIGWPTVLSRDLMGSPDTATSIAYWYKVRMHTLPSTNWTASWVLSQTSRLWCCQFSQRHTMSSRATSRSTWTNRCSRNYMVRFQRKKRHRTPIWWLRNLTWSVSKRDWGTLKISDLAIGLICWWLHWTVSAVASRRVCREDAFGAGAEWGALRSTKRLSGVLVRNRTSGRWSWWIESLD